jgi:hypothetical protein
LINGFTVIADLDIHLAPLDSGSLGNLGVEYGILCLLGAGDVNT